MNSADRGMMSDLLGDKRECSGDVELVGFSEEGVEGLGRAMEGGGIVREDEGGDESGTLGAGGQGGLVEEVRVFDIFGEALQEGKRLVEGDGECDAG